MKRCLILIFALCLLFLPACGGEASKDSGADTVEYNGKTYIVEYNPNSPSGTITVEGMVCEFFVTGSGDSLDFKVTYPDGSTYWWKEDGVMGYGGWSDDYDPPYYAEGDVLWKVLDMESPAERQSRGGAIFLGLLVIGAGLIDVIWPRTGWYLSHGWRYKNAEPSEAALLLGRLGGIVVVLLGLGIMFFE